MLNKTLIYITGLMRLLLIYFLGMYMIMQTPSSAIKAPIISYLSGLIPSTFHAQSRAIIIKMPPYVAYTRPKLEVCQVATTP